jgi:hypothetical protein
MALGFSLVNFFWSKSAARKTTKKSKKIQPVNAEKKPASKANVSSGTLGRKRLTKKSKDHSSKNKQIETTFLDKLRKLANPLGTMSNNSFNVQLEKNISGQQNTKPKNQHKTHTKTTSSILIPHDSNPR